MTKRLALCLFGLSVCKYAHWDKQHIYMVNYKNSVENYREYIYKYFQDKGYTIDVYLSTNEIRDEDKQGLLDTYQPIKCSFEKDDTTNVKSRNVKVNSVIDLCLSSNIPYDVVLLTRFDLLFQKPFHESNIDLTKFNLVSILEHQNAICDNFYLLPFRVLPLFSTIVKNHMHASNHFIRKEIESIEGVDFVNYILNEYCVVKDLSFYKTVRIVY